MERGQAFQGRCRFCERVLSPLKRRQLYYDTGANPGCSRKGGVIRHGGVWRRLNSGYTTSHKIILTSTIASTHLTLTLASSKQQLSAFCKENSYFYTNAQGRSTGDSNFRGLQCGLCQRHGKITGTCLSSVPNTGPPLAALLCVMESVDPKLNHKELYKCTIQKSVVELNVTELSSVRGKHTHALTTIALPQEPSYNATVEWNSRHLEFTPLAAPLNN